MDGLLDLLKRVGALKRAPRTSKGRYPALESPYKPILLLVALKRIQQDTSPYSQNRITYDACLRDFTKLYSRLYGDAGEMEPKVVQAFWYLATGKPRIWSLIPRPGMATTLKMAADAHEQIKTSGKLNRLVEAAAFDTSDWDLLNDSDVQQALISFLISGHFPDVRHEVEIL